MVAQATRLRNADELIALGTSVADPELVTKVHAGRRADINVCIACNQACLDYIFTDRTAICLVNPKAGHEIEFDERAPLKLLKIGVVGSGLAGMSAAIYAARRGHQVTLFEADRKIGGQLNLASRIPGKSEFNERLRYFSEQLRATGVEIRCGVTANMEMLRSHGFDHVIAATGVLPRRPDIPGIEHVKVVIYNDLLSGHTAAGRNVAIIGAGGIGFDVAEYLSAECAETDASTFFIEWGATETFNHPAV